MSNMFIKTTLVASCLVATLFLSGCSFLSRGQVAHMNDTAFILEIEAERGERVIELLGGNAHANTREEVVGNSTGDHKQIAEFIWQRNQVLRNAAKSIKITVGGSD